MTSTNKANWNCAADCVDILASSFKENADEDFAKAIKQNGELVKLLKVSASAWDAAANQAAELAQILRRYGAI